jgi:hypothetical protein
MKIQILICFFTLSLFAKEDMPITKLQNGVYIGLGASYNSIKIDQQLNGTEFSSVFTGSSLIAFGEAGGQANPYYSRCSTLAPQAQLGYLHRFSNSSWFLSCKAVYQYLDATFTENNLNSFQNNIYLTVNGSSDIFTGHLFISSSQIHVDHEIFLLPVFGYFFDDICAYLGVGPVVFNKQHKMYGITGFARINGVIPDIIETTTNLSISQWIWGGIAQLGCMYPFASTWFLDFNYSYAVTGKTAAEDSVIFSNSLITGTVYTEEGIAFVKTKQRVTAQSFTVSINKVF